MKMYLYPLLAISFSAQGLVTFQSGDVATAEDFNSNFLEVKNDASTNANAIEGLKNNTYSKAESGRVSALVNGEARDVYSIGPGYNIVYFGLNQVAVNSDGELYSEVSSYHESSDCSGQPYVRVNFIDQTKPIGVEFLNPQINPKINFHKINGQPFYETGSPLVKLHFSSMSRDSVCSRVAGTNIGAPVYANDPDVTQVTFPLLITGIGTKFSITEEIGTPLDTGGSGNYKVYGNGVEFGYITSLPTSPTSQLRVTLNDYNQQVISVNADGSYSGFNNGGSNSRDMYFKAEDCLGTGYFPYLPLTYAWWDITDVEYTLFKNGGEYYNTGGQLYVMNSAPLSYKKAGDGECTNTVSGTGSSGDYTYREAELTANPELTAPVINTPITIEGWNPSTTYQDLPEVN